MRNISESNPLVLGGWKYVFQCILKEVQYGLTFHVSTLLLPCADTHPAQILLGSCSDPSQTLPRPISDLFYILPRPSLLGLYSDLAQTDLAQTDLARNLTQTLLRPCSDVTKTLPRPRPCLDLTQTLLGRYPGPDFARTLPRPCP